MTFHDGDLCLADSATTHTILKENKYFEYLTLTKANVTTISGPADMIKGSGKANIVLPNNTRLSIKDALYSPESRRNLLSFKDIRANGYHIETTDKDKKIISLYYCTYFRPEACT
ncbi:Disease resistance protein CC-NBS-LRR class family [Salix suchowensis]|nr:Disease resistance protein CC-NBS-LRR class family [Salix suchowensis]